MKNVIFVKRYSEKIVDSALSIRYCNLLDFDASLVDLNGILEDFDLINFVDTSCVSVYISVMQVI